MNRSKSTLVIASIMVAGALTGVALAILLQQALPYRHQHVYGLGTPGTSVDGANGANGALGVNGNNANAAAIGISFHGPNGLNGRCCGEFLGFSQLKALFLVESLKLLWRGVGS